MTEKLFTPVKLGALSLPNRVLMAPLTRNRAKRPGDVPTQMNARYYAQRASAGLIISEGTQISPEGKGYIDTPGIYSDEQVAGWRLVTDAVHEAGGRIVAQLWHVGRVSHISLQPDSQAPVAPSAIRAEAKTYIEGGFSDVSDPRELKTDEIGHVVEDYGRAAKNALAAGFDGVELHAANGYLVDQFIRDGSNTREDAYGGPLQNRLRFLREVLESIVANIDADRVGVRFAPFSNGNGISDSDPMTTFSGAIEALNPFGLAYLHMVEGQIRTTEAAGRAEVAELRKLFKGSYVANNGYDRDMAIKAVASGAVDAVAFGRDFIANPDLPKRLEINAPLNEQDRDTFYGGQEHGYTDYPFLDAVSA
ncbi:alkene reductase [Acuticoccus sediminis]|uniref:Alkene reductase n=1 Tax=Acuticoccus sediminis TaxID=2184697 RepID=A0A8B2P0Y2_9HYPH|nr:alkene reductase [Acuticoccus sediminis]RAI04105.1 alkene reductase [Acuticoccus sediminis]